MTDVWMSSADAVTIVGTDGLIMRTDDGGTTWIKQKSGTTAKLHAVTFSDVNQGTAVGEFGIILHTKDGGTTWVKQKKWHPQRFV